MSGSPLTEYSILTGLESGSFSLITSGYIYLTEFSLLKAGKMSRNAGWPPESIVSTERFENDLMTLTLFYTSSVNVLLPLYSFQRYNSGCHTS